MNLEDRIAILKMAGFVLKDHGAHRSVSTGLWFRYVCERETGEGLYGSGDTKAEAVNNAWIEFNKGLRHEKVS